MKEVSTRKLMKETLIGEGTEAKGLVMERSENYSEPLNRQQRHKVRLERLFGYLKGMEKHEIVILQNGK